MAVTVEVHHTGDPELRAGVLAAIEHVFADRAGDWRVSVIGSQANNRWEMRIAGPNGFERSYTFGGQLRGTSAGGDSGYFGEDGACKCMRG
ncbi:MAG TPA: hypothetical protein VN948_10900 [Terriglobales bacterium]|nr:hypothetical protein [Terriglobales bacterium]